MHNQIGMLIFLLAIFLFHYLISYLVCRYFNRSHDERLSKLGTFLVVILSGPITFAASLLVILITPLSQTDAGVMDGGGALLVLVSLFIFPVVSNLLVRFFIKKQLVVKNA